VISAGPVRARLDDESPYAVVRQLARVLVLVENEYVDAVERDRLLAGAIQGMVAQLDPHSAYLPPRDYSVLQDDTRGEFAGIGVEVDFRNDRVTVISPIEGSPAHRAGILPGDVIVSIDGRSVHGKNASDLVKRMRGPRGSSVEVSIRRRDEERVLKFTLQRAVIEVSSVLGADLEGSIAYLRIKQFQSKTHSEILESIAALRARLGFIRAAILDMRNNPGGLVHAASAVAGEFLDDKVIYSTRHRGRIVETVKSGSGGALHDVPLVVLVNEFSASASELLAGALQDNARATIVGARTFGKGSVQSILDLPGGAGLRLTTMRYYTPAGRAIQVEGITPDVNADTQLSSRGDITVLREGDLENHLRSEEERAAAAPKGPVGETLTASDSTGEAVGLEPTHLGVARTIPENPSRGPDAALAVAYEVLLEQLAKRR
jgi:carboxyl-terminal processing protease